MSVFEQITVTWKGVEYSVEPDNVLKLIAKVEDIVTFSEINNYAQKGAAPLGKLAIAFGTILRYAGAKVNDDEVYLSIIKGDANYAAIATQTVLAMMIPPLDVTEGTKSGKS